MSVSLAKERAEKIGKILLSKGILTAPTMRVGNALDISASMSDIIARGDLQKAFDQTMGVSVKFDDDGDIDVFKFDHVCEYVGTADIRNYTTFLKKNGITARGATSYSPIVDKAMDFFFGSGPPVTTPKVERNFFGFKKKSADPVAAGLINNPAQNIPVLMLIHTDGEPSPDDIEPTLRALKATQDKPIYWSFVGVGGNHNQFPTIAKLADALPNVGEVYLPSFNMSDDDVYSQVICSELVEWIGKRAPVQA